jgi:phage internal scaffolding protein
MTRIKWRDQYDDEGDAEVRAETDIHFNDPSLAQQQYTDEVNINTMVKRMGIHDGDMPAPAFDPRYYGDFTDALDFRDSLDRVREAAEHFNALPAELRKRFDNDPVVLHHWISNRENAEEAVTLGLLTREPTPAPQTPPGPPVILTGTPPA